MHILLFILYAAILSWILTRRPFFRDIHPRLLIAFFALRVAAGCLHNWVAFTYYPGHGDIWRYFNDSFVQRHLLFTDLHAFWTSNWEGIAAFSYLQHNIIEWTHILFNFLSFDNFYINTLFFSFLTLGGHVALFRVFYARFEHDALSAAAVVLLPSVLFWTSCMHTEGFLYAILGWLLYTMHRTFSVGWTGGRIALVLLLTALAILFRPAIAVGLLPALTVWTAIERQISPRTILLTAGALILLIAGLSRFYPDMLNILPRTLSVRQQEYQSLTGNSRIPLPALHPDWASLWKVLPAALFNGWFQPLPGAGGQKVYSFFSLELLVIWITAILALLMALTRYLTHTQTQYPPLSQLRSQHIALSATCLLLALPGMLLIGYIIPFVGAIVRYRSIYLPFLLAPCLACFQHFRFYEKLNNWLTRHILK